MNIDKHISDLAVNKAKHSMFETTPASRSIAWLWMIMILVFTGSIIGCFDLDNSLFKNDTLSSYDLRTTVIPESSRTQVVLLSDGKKIYGYFVQSSNTNEKNIILYNHGNRDHLQFYWDRVELFYKMGFNVFIYDYQGYGMSEGEPTEAGIYSDATAAYEYVKSRGFGNNSIAVYGFSLGGAPAVYLAANVFSPKVLITESAFASSSALVQSGTLLDIPNTYVMKGEYNNAERIKQVTVPYLLLHGIDDKFIDLEKNGRVIFRNANDPKKLITVIGAGHSDLPEKMGELNYLSTVKNFVLTGQ